MNTAMQWSGLKKIKHNFNWQGDRVVIKGLRPVLGGLLSQCTRARAKQEVKFRGRLADGFDVLFAQARVLWNEYFDEVHQHLYKKSLRLRVTKLFIAKIRFINIVNADVYLCIHVYVYIYVGLISLEYSRLMCVCFLMLENLYICAQISKSLL